MENKMCCTSLFRKMVIFLTWLVQPERDGEISWVKVQSYGVNIPSTLPAT